MSVIRKAPVIVCDWCGAEHTDQSQIHGIYRGAGNVPSKGASVWLSSPSYADLTNPQYTKHLCNRCHVELCWCHPGGQNNPLPANAEPSK